MEFIDKAIRQFFKSIEGWMQNHGIELVHTKTEAVMLTRKWVYRQPGIFSRDHHAKLTRSVKYLGVTHDSKLTFTHYIRATSTSVVKAAKAIGRLMPNVGGPSVENRKLLANVAVIKQGYATLVWVWIGVPSQFQDTRQGPETLCHADDSLLSYDVNNSVPFLAEILPEDKVVKERELQRRRARLPERQRMTAALAEETGQALLAQW